MPGMPFAPTLPAALPGLPGRPLQRRPDLHRNPRPIASAATLALCMALAHQAGAVPPPVAREARMLDAAPNGAELVLRDTVRPYQPVELLLPARAGDRLLLRLDDGSRVLVLQLEAAGGQPLLDGAVPGPDGLVWQLAQDGLHRLRVAVSADAARTGQAASFTLGLRLRRDPATPPAAGAAPTR